MEKAQHNVHREDFVPEDFRRIGHQSLVTTITELLDLDKTHSVLEIGTGSGYQTALLAELSEKVYSVEVRPALSAAAQAVLLRLGYANVEFKVGAGARGWVEKAPFDRILVSAVAHELPMGLFHQLKEDGRMLIPLETEEGQELFLITSSLGQPVYRPLLSVEFLPLM